ncbi:site-specific integrase [Nocardioides baekrokdamisoli]|uniref:Site-specific integrase n=1 Tax=Nocardioides baekrokdamisoli TaxID=1804624 RepID=A0A3G9IV50_9ACTN|nr:tyrosine-type recombinase/integrase [Nocardioides baekrokdamisoli]BBH17541.1 site-specific integrase [Nocardioides baekrokdamisoli]
MAEPAKARRKPESWGAIRRLPSGRYQATYVVDGERFKAPHTFSDDAKPLPGKTRVVTGEDKARDWLRGIRVDIERSQWENPYEVARRQAEEEKTAHAETFGEYAAAWVEQRRSGKGDALRPKTATEYRRQLSRGLAEFSSDRLPAITPARVRAWHATRAGVAPTAAGAEARLLRAIMNTAALDGIVDRNPVPTNLTRTTTGKAHRPPTQAELNVILGVIESRYVLAVLLSAYGGLRLSEWRALRRKDLIKDGDRYLLNIERQAQYIGGSWVVGPPKSAEGVRVVSLPAWASKDVSAHLAAHVGPFPDDLVFAPQGRSEFIHDSAFRDAWNPAREAAGLRLATKHDKNGNVIAWENVVREHDLRGFAGTLHAQSGATQKETMAFLGHSTTQAAMAYQHAAEDRLREIADRMPAPTPTTKPTASPIRKRQ